MARNKSNPKASAKPPSPSARAGGDPDSYLKLSPVWRFSDFDWESAWGVTCLQNHITDLQKHIQQHLASFESMTWEEILAASGGRREGSGGNSHHISTDKFKKEIRDRLKASGINADTLFSLRLDAGTRVYGIREHNCLRIVFFDPYHKDRNRCAYEFKTDKNA